MVSSTDTGSQIDPAHAGVFRFCPPENEDHDAVIRQAVFKTRRGLPYRAIFVVKGDAVNVNHIRGSDQDRLETDELQFP